MEFLKSKAKNCDLLFNLQFIQSINKHLLRKTGRTKMCCALIMCQTLGLAYTDPLRSHNNSATQIVLSALFRMENEAQRDESSSIGSAAIDHFVDHKSLLLCQFQSVCVTVTRGYSAEKHKMRRSHFGSVWIDPWILWAGGGSSIVTGTLSQQLLVIYLIYKITGCKVHFKTFSSNYLDKREKYFPLSFKKKSH